MIYKLNRMNKKSLRYQAIKKKIGNSLFFHRNLAYNSKNNLYVYYNMRNSYHVKHANTNKIVSTHKSLKKALKFIKGGNQ